jgi:hypothetical protein
MSYERELVGLTVCPEALKGLTDRSSDDSESSLRLLLSQVRKRADAGSGCRCDDARRHAQPRVLDAGLVGSLLLMIGTVEPFLCCVKTSTTINRKSGKSDGSRQIRDFAAELR